MNSLSESTAARGSILLPPGPFIRRRPGCVRGDFDESFLSGAAWRRDKVSPFGDDLWRPIDSHEAHKVMTGAALKGGFSVRGLPMAGAGPATAQFYLYEGEPWNLAQESGAAAPPAFERI